MSALREILAERYAKEADFEDTGLAAEASMYMNLGYKLAQDSFFEKEALLGRAAGWVGKKLISGAGKVSKGGRVSKAIGRASKAVGGQNLRKAVGGAALGAGAIGTAGFAAGRLSKGEKRASFGAKLTQFAQQAKVPALAALGAGAVGAGGYAVGREHGRDAEEKAQLRQDILDRLFGPGQVSATGEMAGGPAPAESGMTSPYGVY